MGADAGIVAAIKQLDVKLPDSIMKAMGNGPELEKTVSRINDVCSWCILKMYG